MFDDLIRELKQLEQGMEVSVPIDPDEDGYLDKECPSEACLFQFKIFEEDWVNLVSDEEVFCPLCGHSDPADSWWTTEQLEEAEHQALEQIQGRIDDALRRGARGFNRAQPRRGFIRMSMEVKGTRARRGIVPVPGSEPLDLRITCEGCEARYAVLGSAFFCPACGESSAVKVFDDSIRKVRLKPEAADSLRAYYTEQGERDDGEVLARSLLETALTDCVVAFQRLNEQLYRAHPKGKEIRNNVFQRLNDGSGLWREVLGEGFEDWIADDDWKELNIFFQRRHLLQHTEGVVDERYVERSGDRSYRVGQRIVVRERDVTLIAGLVSQLADELRSRL